MNKAAIFESLTTAKMAQLIKAAKQRVIFAGPGIRMAAAEAVVAAAEKCGKAKVLVAIDCDEKVMRNRGEMRRRTMARKRGACPPGMKSLPLVCAFLMLLAVAAQLPAQNTNTSHAPRPEATQSVEAEAQLRYQEDGRTNRITLDKPLYTNAPWSEDRLRASALKGDGLAASLCSGSNASHQRFWLSLAATNGWIPSQVHLARDFEYERPKEKPANIFDDREVFSPELEEILKQPKAARQTASQFWRDKATAALPELKDDAAHNDARAIYALGLLHQSGDLVESNAVLAVEMFHKAAESGLAPAQCMLGLCYQIGQGVAKDQAETVKWYRKAAEQNYAPAQYILGWCYGNGEGVTKDEVEAVKWYRKAADQDYAPAQDSLGNCFAFGEGVVKDEVEAAKWFKKAAEKDPASAQARLGSSYFNVGLRYDLGRGEGEWIAPGPTDSLDSIHSWDLRHASNMVEAVKWYRKAAEQNYATAQYNLGLCYEIGEGVTKDDQEAVKWFRKAAGQNHALAQYNLGFRFALGQGVVKDEVEGYKWFLLSAAQGNKDAKRSMAVSESRLTREQIAEGQKLARNFKPREAPSSGGSSSRESIADSNPSGSGTGLFITEDGFLITSQHVVEDAAQIRLVTSAGLISAKVVKVDAANDLALLKAEGRFGVLPVASSRGVKLGGTVATVGFPNIGLQGFAPKLAKGEIASLSGAGDDARYFQISVPVQPGNSGGALVDERGNVVGVVSAKLSARAALAVSGALPENVNYAVKSSYLLSFLESVPAVSAKLQEPNLKERKFEEVVKDAEQAAVLVLVY